MDNFLSIPLILEVLHGDILFEFKNAFIFKHVSDSDMIHLRMANIYLI